MGMSPMSNHLLFWTRGYYNFPGANEDSSATHGAGRGPHPIKELMNMGFRIALTSDDPTQFHTSSRALLEEYKTAEQECSKKWETIKEKPLEELIKADIHRFGESLTADHLSHSRA